VVAGIKGKFLTKQGHLVQGPHQGQPIRMAGEPVSRARAAMLMLHGAVSADDICRWQKNLVNLDGAPQAAENTCIQTVFVPCENEPWLSALAL
jgi:hypothetical protein